MTVSPVTSNTVSVARFAGFGSDRKPRNKGGKFKKRLGKTSFWKIRVLLNLAPKGVGFDTPVDKNASGDDFGCRCALTGTPFAANCLATRKSSGS